MGCVWIQKSSQGITIGEGKEKRLQWFLTKGWVALSKKWVCCVVKTYLGFSL